MRHKSYYRRLCYYVIFLWASHILKRQSCIVVCVRNAYSVECFSVLRKHRKLFPPTPSPKTYPCWHWYVVCDIIFETKGIYSFFQKKKKKPFTGDIRIFVWDPVLFVSNDVVCCSMNDWRRMYNRAGVPLTKYVFYSNSNRYSNENGVSVYVQFYLFFFLFLLRIRKLRCIYVYITRDDEL